MIKLKQGRPKKPKTDTKLKKIDFSQYHEIINDYKRDLQDRLEDEDVKPNEVIFINELFKLDTYKLNIWILKAELKDTKNVAIALGLPNDTPLFTYLLMNTKKELKAECQRQLQLLQ